MAIIITFIIGILILIGGIIIIVVSIREGETALSLFGIFFIGLGLLTLYAPIAYTPEPTEEDVLAGKAVYQETITITQTGDSIKTYQIVWKGEDK